MSVTWHYVVLRTEVVEGDSAEGFNQPVYSRLMPAHTHTHYVAAGAEIKMQREGDREM